MDRLYFENQILTIFPLSSEMCLLSDDIYDYHFVSQGKIEIPNVDDAEEMRLTDVSIDAQNVKK